MSRKYALLPAFLGLLAGCQYGPKPSDASPPPASQGQQPAVEMTGPRQMDSLVLATYRPIRPDGSTPSAALARLEGKLAARGDCLVVLSGSDPASALQPVFPEGVARWDRAAQELHVHNARYRLGSTIVLGGGGVGDPARFKAQEGTVVPRCPGTELFVVSG